MKGAVFFGGLVLSSYLAEVVVLEEGLRRLKERRSGSADDLFRFPCKVVWGFLRDSVRI